MAFAVTSYRAYPIYLDSAVPRRAVQHYELDITGTTADVVLDISDPTGTFWTDADGSTVGLAALAALNSILLIADHRISDYLQGVTDSAAKIDATDTLATKEYKYTNTDPIPDYALYAGEGLTSYKFHVCVALDDNKEPVVSGF